MAHTAASSSAPAAALIATLSRLPPARLSAVVNSQQQAQHVAALLESRLSQLANDALELVPSHSSEGDDVLALLAAVQALGDSSLATNVIPSPSTALDLLVVSHARSHLAGATKPASLKKLLPALVSEAQRMDLLVATTATLDKRPSPDALRRAALVVASIQHQLPGPADGLLSTLDRAWKASSASGPARPAKKGRNAQEAERLLWLASRAQLIETAWQVLVSGSRSPPGARAALEEAQSLLAQDGAEGSTYAGEPLSHGGLLFNLSLVRPLDEALARLEHTAAAGATALAQPTGELLSALHARAKQMGLDPQLGARPALQKLGSAWTSLARGLHGARREAQRIESVLAVLPDLGGSTSARLALALRLSSPDLVSLKSDEELIARLLDAGDDDDDDGDGASDDEGSYEFDDERSYDPPSALGASRRNVFADSLDEGSLRWAGKGRGDAQLDMSAEERQASKLRTLQLLREEEQRAKEAEEKEWEEAGLGEWMGLGRPGNVVEEEDVDEDELQRFGGRRDHLDETDDEAQGGADGPAQGKGKGKQVARELPGVPTGPRHDGKARPAPSGPTQAQNILLTAYALEGAGLFASTPLARQSKARAQLRERLDEEARSRGDSTRWADDLVESWAKMLERNPRKDALLASATDAVLGGGNEVDGGAGSTQQGGGQGDDGEDEDEEGGASRFGPDRMQGGRIPGERGRGRGRGGRGGGARGGGRGGGPSASEQRASQSAHSGANRTRLDRQKESRGNAERKRGRDRKLRGGMVG